MMMLKELNYLLTEKIYVSLNMLQSSSISYAKEFGARGRMEVFPYINSLRVISLGLYPMAMMTADRILTTLYLKLLSS